VRVDATVEPGRCVPGHLLQEGEPLGPGLEVVVDRVVGRCRISHVASIGRRRPSGRQRGVPEARPLPPEITSDEALCAVALVLRAYHDAQDADPTVMVMCHNDVRPETVVLTDGRPSRLRPSPWAAPGTRRWDVAGAVWRWVPLLCDWDAAALGFDDGL